MACGVVAYRGASVGGALGLVRRYVMDCACLWSRKALYAFLVSSLSLALRWVASFLECAFSSSM